MPESVKTNREEKDALFKIIFAENPENALSLYNAINNSNYTNVDDLMITVLRDSLYIGIKNDVSFLFNDDMNLYEHQSTYCPNMPLRGLGYFADLYKIHLGGEEMSNERMYDDKLLQIPTPRYYVFYNGTEKHEERTDLRLSSAYKGKGDVEVTAHMVNINRGCSNDLMEQCKPLSDYSELIARLREYMSRNYTKEDAVALAIDTCIDDGILEELLRKERARVRNILIDGLTEEEKERLREYQIDRARREARFDDVSKIVESGLAGLERACGLLDVDIDAYREYIAETADEIE